MAVDDDLEKKMPLSLSSHEGAIKSTTSSPVYKEGQADNNGGQEKSEGEGKETEDAAAAAAATTTTTPPDLVPDLHDQDLERSGTRASSVMEYSVFPKGMKRYIVICSSCAGFFSPLSSQIYFPALNTLASDLHVSISLINLTLTSYMVCLDLWPLIYVSMWLIVSRYSKVLRRFLLEILQTRLAEDLRTFSAL